MSPFEKISNTNSIWQDRSEFDLLLLNHARSCGADVYEQTKVTGITFSPDDPTVPISASWVHTPSPSPMSPPASPAQPLDGNASSCSDQKYAPIEGTTTFGYLIDASGRAGIMSTTYLKNRHFNSSLKNIAVWGYWNDVGTYGVGTPRQGAPWFEALTGDLSPRMFLFLELIFCRRRIWLGLVHPLAKRKDIRWHCDEPGKLHRQKQVWAAFGITLHTRRSAEPY